VALLFDAVELAARDLRGATGFADAPLPGLARAVAGPGFTRRKAVVLRLDLAGLKVVLLD
jgi:hypothetical protein